MKYVVNPTNLRKNLYQLLNQVNESHQEITIIGEKENSNAVLVSLDDWKAIQETLYLERTGVLDEVRKREQDDSGFTNIDDIDWENL